MAGKGAHSMWPETKHFGKGEKIKKTISIAFDRIHTIILGRQRASLLSYLKTSLLVLALGLIASVTNADFSFGTPTNLGPKVNSSAFDGSPNISADGLWLFFDSFRLGWLTDWDIWVTTRDTTDGDWGPPVLFPPPINSWYADAGPSISADGLSLFFASDRPGGYGNFDLWVTTRKTIDEPWGPPVNLGPTVNSSAYDNHPSISADGLSLYFDSGRPGGYGYDLWVVTRAAVNDDWGTPVNLGPATNVGYYDLSPNISYDGLALFFDSRRSAGDRELWVATRQTTEDDWRTAVNLGPPVNSYYHDADPSIAAGGSTLYFCSGRPGGIGNHDLWQAPILPVVDFNGDGIVDIEDLIMLIEYWGQDEPSVDIAPPPFGDGIIDVQDLEVLMSYWHQEILPASLLAYWKLDETEGFIAQDSAGVYDGVLNGVPTWQPIGGKVAGALELDGIDDYVSTPFVLRPADGAFSVVAWVKGGGPGQVIISQTGDADWLLADPSEGKLMTGLSKPAGGLFPPQPLVSEFVITDGNWHRVGFVWDGSNRILYVDDVETARDTQSGLEGYTYGGLHLGAGKNLEPGSFWTGLMDDVRIYNQAVSP